MLSKSKCNLPNLMTIGRILLIPFLILFLYFDRQSTNIVSCIIFIIASVTDFVDGYVARKYNIVTDLGKIIDPAADKILVASALVVLVDLGRVSAIVVIILLARDFAVGALRDLSASRGKIIAAGRSGKLKTLFQMLAVGFLIYKGKLLWIDTFFVGTILIYIAVILSVYSGIEYFIKYFKSDDRSLS